MKIIDYIKEHKSLIIIITILIAAFILIGVLIFNGNEDQNYKRKYDESKTKYKINEVVPIYVNQEQMAKKYLSEYVNLIVFDEEKAVEIMKCDAVTVYVDMHEGTEEATAWGCDLTYDYVKINADYRS